MDEPRHERRILIEVAYDPDSGENQRVVWTYCTVCPFIAVDLDVRGAIEDWKYHLIHVQRTEDTDG